ncbi:MAG: phosphatidate cytidylyltransferase [Thermomicrobiales bacterium]|nr:phosphatidate cytidylyltransferase [Thermomicrobiales bacterium]
MRIRAASSIGVVLIALVPTILGGPFFALLMIAIGVIGFREFLTIARYIGPAWPGGADTNFLAGALAIVAFGVVASLEHGATLLPIVLAFTVGLPLVGVLAHPPGAGSVSAWSWIVAGVLYLAVPVYMAIDLRSAPGVAASWLERLAFATAFTWPATARGLAWVLLVLLTIWVADSAAYLVGRSFGRRPLAPLISPKKTIEGSLGGLLGAVIVAAACWRAFGLGPDLLPAIPIGLALGIAGQIGDLCESALKRAASIKDSGNLIPGHGGMLDRVDALLFAFPVGWGLAAAIDRWLIV